MSNGTAGMTGRRIVFVQRPGHRARQRDTLEATPGPWVAISTLQPGAAKDEHSVFRRSVSASGRLRSLLLRMLVPLNVRWLPRSFRGTTDLVYTWGSIPMGAHGGWVVECDTPYVLSFYGVTWFRLMRPVVRALLARPSCRAVVCISEACRRAMREELGPSLDCKLHVVYPVPPAPAPGTGAERAPEEPLRLLFISTQFVLKGGRELVSAVRALVREGHQITLTLVTDVEAVRAWSEPSDDFITILPASLPRARIRDELLANAHALVHPTLQESFGMVLLEALAAGLPIVATDLFAADEIVHHGANGMLVEPPIRYYGHDKRAQWRWWGIDLEQRLRAKRFDDFAARLVEAIRPLLNEQRRRAMAAASRDIYAARFAAPVRDAAFIAAIEGHPASRGSAPLASLGGA
jgi:glycosyltransferase involved in cell wall biosynthesis